MWEFVGDYAECTANQAADREKWEAHKGSDEIWRHLALVHDADAPGTRRALQSTPNSDDPKCSKAFKV
jgi:hypothetical protein